MVVMVGIDVSIYVHQITPLAIIGTIYTALIDLNNLILSDMYNYYRVSDYVLRILLLFFAAIFILDIIFGALYRRTAKLDSRITVRFRSYDIVAFLFLIGAAA